MIIVFNEVNIVNICTIDEITLMKLLEFNFGYLTSLYVCITFSYSQF